MIEDALARAAGAVAANTRIGDAMQYAIAGGGKRLRGRVCMAAYEAVARHPAEAAVADLACAIELIHTYSLVHDDLPCMDDDDMRRGRATTHKVYDEPTAMLAGAALIPLAFRTAAQACGALGLSPAAATAITSALAHGAGATGMVGGQELDLEGEAAGFDLEALERTHSAKTGALLRTSAEVGAIAAGASAAQLAAITEYGTHLGLAFQIADDILDETASTEQLGKTAGKDRSVAKATFPAVMGLAGARARAQAESQAALVALERAGLVSDVLAELCRFAVERKR